MNKGMLYRYRHFIKFLMVGVMNTFISYAIMQIAYQVLRWGYWGSSVVAYMIGAFFSFFANKSFTFQDRHRARELWLKYILNISVCYILAYGLAKNLVYQMMAGFNTDIPFEFKDQIAMLCGMALYTVFNFVGQKKMVFASTD